MTARARFTQADITRAIRGVTAGGCRVARIEIEPDGTIVVIPEGAAEMARPNPLDRLLKR